MRGSLGESFKTLAQVLKERKGWGTSLDEKMTTLRELLTKWNDGKFRGAQVRYAIAVGVSEPTVSRWVAGDYPPDPEIREKAARVLGLKVPALMDAIAASKIATRAGVSVVRDVETMFGAETGYRFAEIPHLGVVSASRFMFSFDLPPEHFTTLAIRGGPGERYAMLRISGDCMAPRIEDGDEVLIKQASEVTDGTIAIVSFDGECTMKRVYRKKNGVELRADNPEYKAVTYPSSKVRILAEVVKIIKDPKRKP